MLAPVINQAKKWGFICQQRQQSNSSWLILPQKDSQRWKLEQVEDSWILAVEDVPQLRLHAQEAIAFLERNRLENS